MSRLETILTALPESVDWPQPPEHLATRVGARIRSQRLVRTPPRWAVAAVVAALIVVIGVVPGTRQAVADLLFEAGVRIGFVDRSPTQLAADLDLGEPVPIETASSGVGFVLQYPSILDPPRRAHLEAGAVTMIWEGPILLTQRAGGEAFAEKGLGPATEATVVVVAGEPGLWIEGAEHTFTLLDADGELIEETTRLAANVLLWSSEGIDFRLELTDGLERALEIAGSLEKVGR